jgi:hypothetical protein
MFRARLFRPLHFAARLFQLSATTAPLSDVGKLRAIRAGGYRVVKRRPK